MHATSAGIARKKMGIKMPIKFPSFVYRQDGHELSYFIGEIIAIVKAKVNLFLHKIRFSKDFVDEN